MTRSRNIYNKYDFSFRAELEDLINQDFSQRQCAKMLNCPRRTLYREIRRCTGKYSAVEAQKHFEQTMKIKNENLSQHFRLLNKIEELSNRLTRLEEIVSKREVIKRPECDAHFELNKESDAKTIATKTNFIE